MTTPRIVTRYEWSARSPKRLPAHVALSARTATCTHHDGATPVIIRTFEEACARIRGDQNYHMDGNGWNDIGYNYLVISAPGTDVDGLIFEGRGRDVIGAHCLNWNTPWIGIQVATGGAQVSSPNAKASVRWLHDTFTSAAGHALGKKVHSDGFPTACPGPELKAWVHAGMPVAAPIPPIPTKPAPKPAYPGYPTSVATHGVYVSRMIQTRLKQLNYPVTIDGDFGPQTAKWVGLFQSRHGLHADGVVGQRTWAALWA